MKRFFHTPFGAMLWKEMRENVVWAGLAALAMIGINFLFIDNLAFKVPRETDVTAALLYDFIGKADDPVYTLGVGPVLAVILGILQVLPERRRDQWAFLMHRPLAHTAVFAAKAVAGLFLYAFFLGGALLILWYLKWLPIRQYIPDVPFDWRFMLGGIANLLLGIPFYFAAMLCVMRPARWYGSMVFPLVGCLVLHYFYLEMHEFYQCVGIVLIYCGVLAVAVRSSLAEKGRPLAYLKVEKVATGLALLSGLGPIVVGGVFLLHQWLAIVSSEHVVVPGEPTPPQVTSAYYSVLADGEVIRTVAWDGLKEQHLGMDGKAREVTRLNSRPIGPGLVPSEPIGFRNISRYLYFFDHYYERESAYRSTALYSEKLGRIILFSGGWGNTKYATVDGSAQTASVRRKVMLPNIIRGYVWFSDGIYYFNYRQAVLQPLLIASDIESVNLLLVRQKEDGEAEPLITQASPASAGERKIINQSFVVVRTSSIHFYDAQKKLLFTLPREHDRRFYSRVAAQMNREGTRYYVRYMLDPFMPELKRREMPDYLLVLDNKGNVLKRHTSSPLPWKIHQGGYSVRETLLIGLSLPPLAVAGYSATAFYGYSVFQLAPSLWLKKLLLTFPQFFALVALSLTSAMLSCLALWLLRRRSGLMKRSLIVWAITVFLLGPVGLLLFLAMRGWPSRVECPSCGKQRAVDFNDCENCDAPWPQRPKDSADIFPTAPTANS